MKFLACLLLLISQAFAATLNLQGIEVFCEGSDLCGERRTRFENMKGEYRSLVHMKDILRLSASDGGYQSFRYELYSSQDVYNLKIYFQMKPTISEVSIGFTDQNIEIDPRSLLPLREGEFFESQRFKASLENLQKKLESYGFPHNSHKADVLESNGKVRINLAITLGKPVIFKNITSNSQSEFVSAFLKKKFNRLYNKPFELNRFKVLLDEAGRDLFEYGYYLINLDFTPLIKNDRVTLDIRVSHENLFAFDFKHLTLDDRGTMLLLMRDLFRKYKKPLVEASIKSAVQEHFAERAILSSNVEVKLEKFTNKYKEVVTLYHVSFQEGQKTKVDEVIFTGNKFFTSKKIGEMYKKEAFELASLGYYDKEYLDYFAGYLRTKYIEEGFTQVRIQGPVKSISHDLREAKVEYSILEGQRAYLRSIEFERLPQEFEETILSRMKNKPGEPFNPIAFAEDLKLVSQTLQDNGYYYADLDNPNDEDIVRYSKTGADVDVLIRVNPGPIVRFNRAVLLGNTKTRNRVLLKKISLDKDDFITPTKTKEIEAAISATGLFNSVSVYPQKHNSKSASTDLIVRVVERDYGYVEAAPGYRTDLGLKLTGTASYTNIGGANRSITWRTQVNQRLNYQVFDDRRREEHKSLIEVNNSLIYNQGDIFDTKIDTTSSLSWQRRRFYSFDADIIRGNTVLTRDFSRRFSTSLRYQLERIRQWDASNEQDNASFTIGAFTPSLTYDLRNSQTLPVKGAFFNMSAEVANPYFLSQQTQDSTMNFYKLISRNRFYIPFKNGTIAISASLGMEQNLARKIVRNSDGSPKTVNEYANINSGQQYRDTIIQREGFIPNIKVFRLTGMDIVRGFNDNEINRLPDGRDITEKRIQDKAFMAIFKLEPRYFVNDAFMVGTFLDAGRVYVDEMDLGQLRTSAGLTFKILTPVGTLDFDYGFKLLRKRLDNGKLEAPGRFHVSIGFF